MRISMLRRCSLLATVVQLSNLASSTRMTGQVFYLQGQAPDKARLPPSGLLHDAELQRPSLQELGTQRREDGHALELHDALLPSRASEAALPQADSAHPVSPQLLDASLLRERSEAAHPRDTTPLSEAGKAAASLVNNETGAAQLHEAAPPHEAALPSEATEAAASLVRNGTAAVQLRDSPVLSEESKGVPSLLEESANFVIGGLRFGWPEAMLIGGAFVASLAVLLAMRAEDGQGMGQSISSGMGQTISSIIHSRSFSVYSPSAADLDVARGT